MDYSLDDDNTVFCSCDFFKKALLEHIAALECFLKNDEQGRELVGDLRTQTDSQKSVKSQYYFGSVFLDGLVVNEDDTT